MSEWENIKLGSVANIRSGFAFKSKDMGNSGYPIVKIKNISPPTVDVYDVQRVPHEVIEGNERVSYFKLAAGDILIAMTGATVGKVGRMPATIEPYFLNQRVGKVYLKQPERADYNFLYYVLSQEAYVKQMVGIADGSAQANISGKQIESLPILLPPFTEQRAIAHILGSLDDKIELNRRMNETLEAMAHAIFKSWFVDFDPVHAKAEGRDTGLPEEIAALFPDSFEDSAAKKFPKGWKIGTIGDTGKQTRDIVKPEELGANNNYISLEHMPKRSISLWNWGSSTGITSSKFFFKRGDILFGKLRPYFHKVGVPAIEGVCSTDIVVVVPKQEFYFGLLLGHISSDDFVAYANAASTGTKMPRTNWKDMSRYPISIPDSRVLIVYNEYIQNIVKMLHANIHESKILANVRDALLPRLNSGELRLPDAEKFIEEAGV